MEKAEHADREPVLLGDALGTVLDGIRFAASTSTDHPADLPAEPPAVIPLWRRQARGRERHDARETRDTRNTRERERREVS